MKRYKVWDYAWVRVSPQSEAAGTSTNGVAAQISWRIRILQGAKGAIKQKRLQHASQYTIMSLLQSTGRA